MSAHPALLIVHGIGEQHRGETTDKLIRGLSHAFGDALTVERDADGHPAAVSANGRTVRLYEVYWADVLSAEASRGTFTWRFPNTVVWHPLWCRRGGLLPGDEYPAALVWWRVVSLVPLAPAGYLTYLGARFFAQILDRQRVDAFHKTIADQKMSVVERGRAYADFTADGPTRIDEILDSFVADVPNYMASVVAGQGPAFEILGRFHAQMARARADGCDEIHVLAHSLGTVVAFHALSGMGLPDGQPRHAPRRLFTIGSPLEKIRFFWPWTVPGTQPSAHPDFEWVNFYHRADRVSGHLKRFTTFARLKNVRLTGGGGLLRSHVVYERSPEFMRVLTSALFGRAAEPGVDAWSRLKDRGLTWGENLAGPAALLLATLVGLGFATAVVLLPAYVVAWPFRWAGAEALGLRVQNGVALFTLFGMTMGMLAHARERYKEAGRVCERARDIGA